MSELAQVLTVVTALGSGLVAGVFFAFSTFVMKALARLPSAQGVAAMQAINVAAPTAWFMAALVGTALASVALAVTALIAWDDAEVGALQLVGSALYLVQMVLTISYHIPRNDALDAVDPDSAQAAGHWAGYVKDWTAGNHGRTVACLAAATVLTLAVRTM